MGEAEKHPQKAIPAAVQTMIDGMDASPYRTGSGVLQKGVPA
ncbi:hypothetical protein RIE95_07255 [Acidithiobacillus thiooxidans]|nr:hypothetical protein [Acidithiobacillus thiooxidans]MDR7926780.1 hypothetical protein [Acidithiobacillus thiooxidans]